MSDFIHLHNHTHYSLQDGACTVDSLIEAAKKHNMHAVALTDHGVLYGIPEFHYKAKKAGIKPIVGMEAYITLDGNRREKGKGEDNQKQRKKPYRHLILLAKNNTGYHNLMKLSSIGFTEGFYYRPRIDFEVLQQYSEGLIATSACLGGIVSPHIVNNEWDKAVEVSKKFKDVFGGDFYLEIQDHGQEPDKAVLEGVPKLAKQLGIKMVATNDCHYINQEDAIAHNILLLLSDKSGEADYTKLRYQTDQIYFKSAKEMIDLFSGHRSAIENTLDIESKIDLKLEFEGNHFPVFPIPGDSPAQTLDGYFEELAEVGLRKRYKEITPELRERFTYEVATIKKMGFAGYFLVVQDFINASRRMGIPVGPGRGSAAGSLVAYSLGITNIDPIPYSLLFERFLNPARKSMPDIDVDFADDRRGDVINYVKEKYGAECVSQIITFNRLASRAVLRDVARVLKIPIPTVDKITKYIPSKFGKVYSIDEALAEVKELEWVKKSADPAIKNLIKYSRVLEGMNRNMSKHAAGVVIAPGDVTNYVPLAAANGGEDIVTQFNMKELESAGLLKMDFLGLRTLTIIRDAIALVKKNHNVDIDIEAIPLDDEKTYRLFWRGQTTGIFQFESAPMREYLKKLRPTSLHDLSAMNALYRPGPMEFIDDFIDCKFGRKEITYLHPFLEPILKETYGVIVYQEQVIQIANRIAGMSLAEADLLRRAMGKKDLEAMKQQRAKFVQGAIGQGVPEKSADEIFTVIDKFANYGFNKSHSVAYSYLAYQTAYLKAHFPAEFIAANLTNEFGNKDKVAIFLEDCRKSKIEVLPPNINKPSVFFDVEKGKIRFGLSAIKNVGVGAVEEIIRCKEKKGANFKSLFDFCAATDTRTINKRVIEGLILAGAFDGISKNRRALYESVETALSFGSRMSQHLTRSANSLFGDLAGEMDVEEPKMPDGEDWPEAERLAKEREMVGFYVTDHPLRKYELDYRSFSTISLGQDAAELERLDSVRACGIVTALNVKYDKQGRQMAFFTLDDFTGSCECLMFAKVFDKCGKFLAPEAPILIIGRPESSGDAIKLHIDEVVPMDKARERFTKFVKIVIDKERAPVSVITELKHLLPKHHGGFQVVLELVNTNGTSSAFKLDRFSVKLTPLFLRDVYKLLGEESVVLLPK